MVSKHQRIEANLMFLKEDWDALSEYLSRIRKRIQEQKLLANEAVNQSSESWHDNYPFEEAQRQLKSLLLQSGEYARMQELGCIIEPPRHPQQVQFGVSVRYRNLTANYIDEVTIGSHHVFSEEMRDAGVISYNSPLAKLLDGAAVGDQVDGLLNGNSVSMSIEDIQPWRGIQEA